MKTEKVRYGTTHRFAQCQACDWNDGYSGRGDSIERVARAAKMHSEKTGHSVLVESGTSFQYQVS